MNLTKIISYVLLLISLSLAFYLWRSIRSTIEFRESIVTTEMQIVERLEIIREAQKVYHEQFGHYTSNWDSLVNFIQNGVVPITVRHERVITMSYGADSIYVRVDTIGMTPAKDKIFQVTHTINAADTGTFMGYFVKVGDDVIKGEKSYKLKVGDRVHEYTFLEPGRINSMARFNPGDRVNKGQLLISFWNYRFNPDIDITKLNVVPGSGKTFDIYTDKIDRSGIMVSVIEVKDPDPINPERWEGNEAKNRKPLFFGSRTDVSLAGNWE